MIRFEFWTLLSPNSAENIFYKQNNFQSSYEDSLFLSRSKIVFPPVIFSTSGNFKVKCISKCQGINHILCSLILEFTIEFQEKGRNFTWIERVAVVFC